MHPLTHRSFLIAAAAMAVVFLAANTLFLVPLNSWLNASAFCYPLVYLVCDCANRLHGPALARRVIWAGVVIGVPMTFLFVYLSTQGDAVQAARIAVASGMSFFFSQQVNIAVFNRLLQGAWWKAPLVSSALASVVDTPIFAIIGFAGTDLPWQMWIGNVFGKAAMLFILLPVYRVITARAGRPE